MRRLRIGMIIFVVGGVLMWTGRATTTDTVLVARGSVWKYRDLGTLPAANWMAPTYEDSSWALGPAQLGYGDGDEATLVGFGPNASAKYITTYFRRSFTVADPSLYQGLTLRLLRDDGAVVYLNGAEVFRSNMPTGTVGNATLATTAVSGADETTNFYAASLAPSALRQGANVIAVEIHQSANTSSDVSFDAELIASTSLHLTRGPYLQMGTPTSVAIRWRTGAASNSHVMYGPSLESLIWSATESPATTEHEVTLTNLTPGTRYYYSVGSSTQTLVGDATHFFVTAPAVGTPQPTRVWVLGDSGTANANARAVRDAFYAANGGASWANLWLMLGDNAYNSGTDGEFQSAVFDMYPATLRQSVLWPTLGNHDGATADSATGTGPYYDIFTLPRNGEAGGLASGTEAYYSFDYGNIHFICLESFETNRATTGPMLTWLQNDLASTTQKWIVAFWHHPPYSKGSHDSDTDAIMSQMRQNALPILEAGGVDLVLAGHSHAYERSFLLDGHYGTSSTLTPGMKVNGGSGRPDGTGAYVKPTAGVAAHEGAVYSVAGSSGQISGGTLNHPAMFVSMNVLGSMVLDVEGDRLDARFIDNTGATRDYFTITKGATVPLAITTSSLTNGTVGTPYSQTLAATGGQSPYSWSLVAGALPPGLTLSIGGAITGTPTTTGASSFTVRVADGGALQQTADRPLSITVNGPPTPSAFAKSSPTNTARRVRTPVALSWAASANATGYEYCVDTTNDNACAGAWQSAGTSRTATVGGLAGGTIYYWQVRAVNASGTTPANAGTWWRFTTR